jgi:DNA repair protein RadC
MSISDWPAQERPRERLLSLGAAALSDAELLAIFLRTGVSGKSAVDLARELLDRFGGLRPLLESSREQFCQGLGLGDAKYAQLQAVLEMARRHLEASLERGDALENPAAVRRFLTARRVEMLWLATRERMIAAARLFQISGRWVSVSAAGLGIRL